MRNEKYVSDFFAVMKVALRWWSESGNAHKIRQEIRIEHWNRLCRLHFASILHHEKKNKSLEDRKTIINGVFFALYKNNHCTMKLRSCLALEFNDDNRHFEMCSFVSVWQSVLQLYQGIPSLLVSREKKNTGHFYEDLLLGKLNFKLMMAIHIVICCIYLHVWIIIKTAAVAA